MNTKVAIWVVVGLLMVGAFALTLALSDPPPPKRFVIATGDPSGAYHSYGQKLAKAIERQGGPAVEIRTTQGSAENLRLLAEGSVDVAFVQGGVPSALRGTVDLDEVRSIARVYSEPLWVFHRAGLDLQLLTDLRAGRLRIAIGPDGSGTQIIALELLKANGVTEKNAKLLRMAARDAVAAFGRDEVDVIFTVAGPNAEHVQKLLRNRDAELMSFFNHEAYARRLSYLQAVDVDQGLLSLEENLPLRPVTLLAPSATLMTRESTHPRVVELCTRAAAEVFASGNLLDLTGEYPSSQGLEAPQHEAAHRYLSEGESWMSRHVPFWALLWIQRLKLLLIPLLAVLLPAFRVVPAILGWWVRRIIKQHYESLRDAEARMRTATTAEELERELAASDRIEDEMKDLSKRIPGNALDMLYAWRTHVNMVQAEALARLRELRGSDAADIPSSPYGDLSFGRASSDDTAA
jgi:TRAP transporter TAXI family solute receptor